MQDKKLQIKLLSKAGELLNVVNCFAGQVSVFRSTSPNDLRPYQRAFAGIPGPERFSISVNEKPYNPVDHILIGFGERFEADADDCLVSEFMLRHGILQESIRSILVSYDLEHVENTLCSKLQPSEDRLLRIVCATYCLDRAIILNEPFEPLSSKWRERVAELLVNYARTKQQIVAVPSLSYRPEYWIDNESVARIQVGENIQKTIGFGSGATDVNTLINQVREQHKKEKQERVSTPPPPPPPQAFMATGTPSSEPKRPVSDTFGSLPSQKGSGLNALFGSTKVLVVAGSFAAIFTGIIVGKNIVDKQAEQPEKSGSQAVSTPAIGASPTTPAVEPTTVPTNPPAPTVPPPPPEEVAAVNQEAVNAVFILDEYRPEIKRSVLDTFEGNIAPVAANQKPAELRAPRVSIQGSKGGDPSDHRSASTKTASELLSVLQSASGTGEGLPDQVRYQNPAPSSDQTEMTNMDPEQRRELIRQKFLEAIQRAAEQRK